MKFTFPPESKPLDGYTIKRAIHRGGFGEVYYALTDAGKEVALKLLNNNLEVEIRGVSQCLNLTHPNLVTIFDIKQDNDNDHWIVMEYVPGDGLDKVIDQHPVGMPLPLVDRWMHGMCRGLAYLHDRGIVHRDLKPANVYSDDNDIKIGDVGLSKFISESRRSAHTQSVGTVYYMAPEVARGKYGREVDIYGMGVVLYEMLTGLLPFEGETTAEILMKHLSERPNLEPLPSEFRPLIAAALEKDPQKRIPDFPTFIKMYDAARSGQPMPGNFASADGFATADAFGVPQSESQRSSAATGYVPKNATGFAAAGAASGSAGGVQWANEFNRIPAPVRWGMAGFVLLALLRNPVLFEVGVASAVLGGIAWLAHRTWKGVVGPSRLSARGRNELAQTLIQPDAQQSVAEAPRAPVAARNVPRARPAQPVRRRQRIRRPQVPRVLNPDVSRPIAFRQRLTELTGSMTMAVLCTALITGGLYLVADFLKEPAAIGQFGFTTLIASWAILLVSKTREGSGAGGHLRRLAFVGAGICVGFLAYGMDQALLMNLTRLDDLGSAGLFVSVGKHSLTDLQHQPTLAAYVVFFAGLFGLRRWWWHADSFRSRRLKISTALLTLLLGYGLTTVFAFPNVWGMMWALAISAVVQLSSVWTPKNDRTKMIDVTSHEHAQGVIR